MSKLTPSERTNIIAKYLSGQPDPEYDVITTKSGKYQCRKRELRLSLQSSHVESEPVKACFAEPDDRFDTRELIEKMYKILTKDENSKNNHKIVAQPESEACFAQQPEPVIEPVIAVPPKPKRRGQNLFGF
jgi:hypothetical protein